MIVGLKAALCERLVGKIPHKEHIVVRDKRRGQVQQQASLGLPIFFTGMPETIIAHLMKAFRQDMKKKATEELNPLEPFNLPLARIMVLVLECNVAFVHGHQPVIGDGDPKNVTGEVLQDSVLTGSVIS